MARIETDPNYTSPTFSRATAATDLFKKEDVQTVAAAFSTHDHSPGKGLKVIGASIQAPLTLSMANSGAINGQGILNLVDTASDACLVLTAGSGGSRTKTIRVENGALQVVNSANSVVIMDLTDTGNFTATGSGSFSAGLTVTGSGTFSGNVVCNSGTAYIRAPDNVSGTIYLGDAQISRWNATQIRIIGAGGLNVQGPLTIESDQILQFAVNGYFIKGISGQPLITTNASWMVQGGSVYFDSGMASRWYWDSANLHTPNTVVIDGNVKCHAGDGNYYSGASDQTVFGIWNPGELRVKSPSAGNFRAIGSIVAEGGPCQGNGAYVNSASSIQIKHDVTELDPSTMLSMVLNPIMRPVSFYYNTPASPVKYEATPGDAPDPNAPDIAWTEDWYGFIAEEVSQVVPQATGKLLPTDLGIFYTPEGLIPVLWGAVRALEARVRALEPVA